jgi:hypothetical protein
VILMCVIASGLPGIPAQGGFSMGMAYNIFRKTSDSPLVWVEATKNIDEAKKRLISLASSQPGDYFIWDPAEHKFIEPLPKSA